MLDEVLLNCLLDVCIRLKVPCELDVGSSMHCSGIPVATSDFFLAAPSRGPFETTGTAETLGNDGTGTLVSCAGVAIHLSSTTLDKSIRASIQVSSRFNLWGARSKVQPFMVLCLLLPHPLGLTCPTWDECPKHDSSSVGVSLFSPGLRDADARPRACQELA